ncbi:MAG: hypothetical protein A4E57_01905 [Syntrophorhabdaceae bacterium PtaU1.Bin034]|jgi:hypothetical protein|nr:MAG: hypothetical protein A4E57_01905 [Syntrophorhabdaceae bacterium PtaU1.Bin034]
MTGTEFAFQSYEGGDAEGFETFSFRLFRTVRSLQLNITGDNELSFKTIDVDR